VTLRDWLEHIPSGKCQFLREIEQGKALRELAKFQEEENKKRLAK
jgi:hypothetical protein